MTGAIEIRAFAGRAFVAFHVFSLDQVTVATAVDGERAIRTYPTVLQAVASYNETVQALAARFGEAAELLDPFDVCLHAWPPDIVSGQGVAA